MTEAQPAASSIHARWRKFVRRFASFLILATLISWTLSRTSISLERSPRPAGFIRGMLQGALMPMALPNLLIGNDVTIYSARNTGLPYKLGYTVGVNMCGALFFGVFFVRLSQWRRHLKR